ncbi:MAG: enoyl-CoA hydratase/isomerase family protein [Planctomycetes bacterium]|nr:enoyl-CoA hydratase/isomerase family protein [Planctomycetota bacterium]
MPYEHLLAEVRDGLAFLTVNRPDKLNALNAAVLSELQSAFDRFGADPQVRAVILTGAGERAFVAGADISELAKADAIRARETALLGQRLTAAMERLGKPVIAAINGFALGGGCELAMACTVRIAAENAKLGQPEVKLGIIAGFGGTQRLPRLVGRGRALEILLTGEPIDAAEALRIGLVNRVVPKDRLLAEAEALARKMMAAGPVAVRLTLDAVDRGVEAPLETALDLEATLFGACFSTKDMREGTSAFLEKRPAKFTGA